jgi:hypothetical protein
LIVNVLRKGVILDAGLKTYDAPEGRPLQDRLTDCEPRSPMTEIVLEPEPP